MVDDVEIEQGKSVRLGLNEDELTSAILGQQITAHNEPAEGQKRRYGSARFDDAKTLVFSGEYGVSSADIEPKLSVSSSRVSPSSGRSIGATLVAPSLEEAPELEVEDLSAGGMGLRSDEQLPVSDDDLIAVRITSGEKLDHVFEGRVAFLKRDRSGSEPGSRFGIDFDPLPAEVADRYFELLNEVAGETVVESRNLRDSRLSRFREDLQAHGAIRFIVELSGELEQRSDQFVFALRKSVTDLDVLSRVEYLRVQPESSDLAWIANVAPATSGTLSVEAVGRSTASREAGTRRKSGHRVDVPDGWTIELERKQDGAEYEVELVDASIGGIGFWLENSQKLWTRDDVEVALELPSGFSANFQGRVVYVRDGSDVQTRRRAGIAFESVSDSERERLGETLSYLENKNIVVKSFFAALIVLGTLVSILVFGKIVVPESRSATGADTANGADAAAKLKKDRN